MYKHNLIKPKQLSEKLQVSRRTLSRYETAGLLNPIKLNKRVIRYAQSDVDEMIEKFKKGGVA